MKLSPAAVVKKNFGTKKDLVAKLVPMVDDFRSEGADKLRSRLSSMPNKKLLRLYQVEQKVRERFGDRQKLVDHLVTSRKKAGLTADASYVASLAECTKARLLDLTRQNMPERPAKQTAEQRLASKNGRKQRERALAKIKKG